MCNNDVGKGGVRVYEVKQRVALVRVPFLPHKSLTDIVIIHIYTTSVGLSGLTVKVQPFPGSVLFLLKMTHFSVIYYCSKVVQICLK